MSDELKFENADQADPSVSLKLDNEVYEFHLSLGVLRRAQKMLNKNTFSNYFWSNLSPEDMVVLLHCFLKRDYKLSPEKIEEMVRFDQIEDVTAALAKAYEYALPKSAETDGEVDEKNGKAGN